MANKCILTKVITIHKLKGTQVKDDSNIQIFVCCNKTTRNVRRTQKCQKLWSNLNPLSLMVQVEKIHKKLSSKSWKIFKSEILSCKFSNQILILRIKTFRRWRYSCPSFCTGTRGGRCHGKGLLRYWKLQDMSTTEKYL